MEKYKSHESDTDGKNDSPYDETKKNYDVFTGKEIVNVPDKDKIEKKEIRTDAISMKQKIERMTERPDKSSCIIYPENPFKFRWDIFVSFILIISCFMTPLELCFKFDHIVYKIFSYSIDICFLCDIIIIFNTALTTEEFETIEDRGEIAQEYLSGWFWIDTMAIVPFQLFFKALEGEESSRENLNGIIRILRIGRLTKLIRLLKLVRYMKLVKEDKGIKTMTREVMHLSVIYERLAMMISISFLCIHALCCMWLFSAIFTMEEAPGVSTWLDNYEYSSLSPVKQYELSMYFATIISYGNIYAYN